MRVYVVGDGDVAKDVRSYVRADPDLILSPPSLARFRLLIAASASDALTVQTGPRVSASEQRVIAALAQAAALPVLVQPGTGDASEDTITVGLPHLSPVVAHAVALGLYKAFLTLAHLEADDVALPPPSSVALINAAPAPIGRWQRLRRWFGAASALLLLASLPAHAQSAGQATIQARDLSTGALVPNIGDTTNNALRVNVVAGSGGGATGTIGAAVPSSAAPVAVRDNSGNLAYPKLDASGNLLVAVTGAGSGGTSSVDGVGYTAGTTAGTPAMFAFDDTATTACAEDKVCLARLTAQRAIHVNFRNASGTEIGTSSNPIQVTLANTGANATAVKVDGSAATQPVSGTFWQATQPVSGTFWQATQPISAASLPLPSLAATSTKQSDGTQKTQVVDGSGNVIGATSNALDINIKSGNPTTMTVTQGTGTNLHIVCDSGCSSSAGFADNGAFTFGTTAVNPMAGVFDDVSSNTATENSAAIARITANKALHVNFRNASGTEIGTATTPIQVSLANTASNSTAVKVDGSAVTQPVSGTVSITANSAVNVAQLAGTTTDTNSGVKSAGTLRVVLATDQPQLTNKLLVTPDANSAVNISQMNGVTVTMGNGVSGTGVQRVTLASDSTGQVALAAGAATIGALTANQSVNNNQWNGQALASPDANSYVISPSAATATSGAAASTCNILSAASTNATSCKASAGNLYGYEIYNTSTTVYYLRLYNLAAAPTCSSATGFIRTIPIPPAASAGQVGGAVSNQAVGVNYGTGISYCITGGSSSTDNTSAATGVFGEIRYK